jgi:hypothetical protein
VIDLMAKAIHNSRRERRACRNLLIFLLIRR